LRLRIPRRQRHPVRELPVKADLEGILAGTRQGHIEHQDGPGLNIDHTRGGLTKLYRALPTEELASTLVDESDSNGMNPDLGAASANPEHQVGAGVYRGKVGKPDVLKHAQHAELALLIDQGVIGDNSEI
jgi:hypothetical protein